MFPVQGRGEEGQVYEGDGAVGDPLYTGTVPTPLSHLGVGWGGGGMVLSVSTVYSYCPHTSVPPGGDGAVSIHCIQVLSAHLCPTWGDGAVSIHCIQVPSTHLYPTWG